MKNLVNIFILWFASCYPISPLISPKASWYYQTFFTSTLSDSESESRSVLSNFLPPYGLYSPWNSPGQNTEVGSLSLLERIFPTQGSIPGLPHFRQILYQLSHKGMCWSKLCCLWVRQMHHILNWFAYLLSCHHEICYPLHSQLSFLSIQVLWWDTLTLNFSLHS